ncbi:hypothetical protein BDR26DRAFT_588669 [Obelidium mucronatum]|nr:hypothetical protein BDR26DRAFT_588669 [Obelidium mucronatum]
MFIYQDLDTSAEQLPVGHKAEILTPITSPRENIHGTFEPNRKTIASPIRQASKDYYRVVEPHQSTVSRRASTPVTKPRWNSSPIAPNKKSFDTPSPKSPGRSGTPKTPISRPQTPSRSKSVTQPVETRERGRSTTPRSVTPMGGTPQSPKAQTPNSPNSPSYLRPTQSSSIRSRSSSVLSSREKDTTSASESTEHFRTPMGSMHVNQQDSKPRRSSVAASPLRASFDSFPPEKAPPGRRRQSSLRSPTFASLQMQSAKPVAWQRRSSESLDECLSADLAYSRQSSSCKSRSSSVKRSANPALPLKKEKPRWR